MFATKLKEYEETLLTKGKIEGKIDTARRMLSAGLDTHSIEKYTGLSLNEIEKLRHNQD